MSADIKLDEDLVIVEGKWTKLQTWDLMLDAPDRRKTNVGSRRALVHNHEDGLTINWQGDYPGGVTIRGSVVVPDELIINGTDFATTLRLLHAELAALRNEVSTLNDRIATLEAAGV